MKLAFVILQYMAADDTIECVQSIRSHVGIRDYRIILVDNCSPDDAWDRVQNAFGGDEDIILLRTESNLGFARGNNVGYRYAAEHLDPEYIILLNNDVLLIQDGIYEVIADCDRRHGFGVMGPMILTKDGSFGSNPMSREDHPPDRAAMLKYNRGDRIKLCLARLHLLRPAEYFYAKLFKRARPDTSYYLDEHINVRLQGAFWIFSGRYLAEFPDGLDNRTFLYGEEVLLQHHVLRAGLTLLYSPRLCVFHKEDASTDSLLGTGNRKQRFILKNNMISRQIYLDTLAQDDEQIRSRKEA